MNTDDAVPAYSEDVVFDDLLAHLRSEQGLSVVRCGDGEVAILRGLESESSYFYKRQLGYVPLAEHREEIRTSMRQAFLGCDWLGIKARLATKSGRLEGVPPGKQLWTLTYVVLAEQGIVSEQTRFCSADIHYEWLRAGRLSQILRGLEEVYCVSARNLDDAIRRTFGVKAVRSFQIPPEVRFDPDYCGARYYPEVCLEVHDWIERMACPGRLFLTGTGFVGKIFNVWIKQRGAVALDIGSVFDAWANRHTRGSTPNDQCQYALPVVDADA